MSSSSSSASKKKQQDEANLKILRELVALLPNKQCFDCHQRGPTYVNVTIGSFVCTSCSGLLRGLNPPHRVKSISMATFTTDEIEFLKSRGNEYCRHVWLGRYERGGRSPLEDGIAKDDTQMKDYLILKYEKKRWYLSPTEAFASTPPPVQKISPPGQNSKNVASPMPNAQQQSTSRSHSTGTVSAPLSVQNPPPVQSRPSPQPKPDNGHDLLARNPVAAPAQSSTADILFDPFGTTAGFGSSFSSPSGCVHQPPAATTNGAFPGLQPAPSLMDGANVPKSATVPAGFLSGAGQLHPISAQQQRMQNQQQPAASSGDKYSALAELDDLFRSTSPVDAKLGAERRQAIPPSTSTIGAFPPMSTTSNQPFYQARPPAVTATAPNPFSSPGGHTSTNFFGGINQPVAPSSGASHFGYFPAATVGSSPAQPQQGHQAFPQSQWAQMPPINPFAGPSTNPRPAAGAASWNPFL